MVYLFTGYESDITQLSAVCDDQGGKSYMFDRYVKPEGRIRRGASQVTGLRMRKGNMYYKGKKVIVSMANFVKPTAIYFRISSRQGCHLTYC